jgi:Cdc6-like AAA superfamily ATPase
VSVPGGRRPSGLRGRAAELRGRRGECDELDRLLQAVRAGESRALMVHGEPGVGKTVLLNCLAEHASGRDAALQGRQLKQYMNVRELAKPAC